MKKIILISGKAGHGKDSLAKMLSNQLEELGYKVSIDHFARYLKDMCKIYAGWNGEKDEYGRKLLQEIGTDIIRYKLELYDFHVNRICEDIKICQKYFDYVIIPDCRFPNEIELPKILFENQVISIRVNRTNYETNLTVEQQNHLSETALDDHKFDYTIEAKDLGELEIKSKNIIKNI